jgi:ribosome-associated toxin RatA of RatAB toxin-antitoxin module
MLTISRHLSLPYSAAQLYALVNDVESYPQFVPWCTQAKVYASDEKSMRASLAINWQGLASTFTTENKLIENQSISMNLVHGMVKSLSGEWQFQEKGHNQCAVTLDVNIDFGNRLATLLFSKVAQLVLSRVTDAFCERAKVLYG